MNKVYLSGPITGHSYEEARFGWRKELADALAPNIEPLSPMRHEGHLAEILGPLEKNYPSHLFSHSKMIVAKDFLDIQVSDLVVANFLGAKAVSRGTLVELGYAYAIGKTIVVIMEADGSNLHDYPFVTEIGVVVHTLEEAATIINSLLSVGI